MILKKRCMAVLMILLVMATACILPGCSQTESKAQTNSSVKDSGMLGAVPIKVLIIPKFEVGEMSGDFPGEAQLYYEKYCAGGEEYELEEGTDGTKLYVKDGVALCTVGQGKVAAAINTCAVLADERFDFSDAYIVSVGCCGSAKGYGRMGDVYIVSASCDYDLGHHADPRDMENKSGKSWFHDESFSDSSVVMLDKGLTAKVYDKVKDTKLETTEITEKVLKKMFPGEEWATREPAVLRGTSVTGDNYWKGEYDHINAVHMTKTYGCPDPFAVTEMEDVAVANAVKSFDMLDRLINIRVSVNMDVYLNGSTPESLWGEKSDDEIASDDSEEALDIFEPAMGNNFAVGETIIDAILDGEM